MTCALLLSAPARADNEIAVREARLEPGDGGWTLEARFDFKLNSSLEDAVNRGMPLYFTTDFELTRSRWYWFDEKVASKSQNVRLWFQPLTRQYRVSTGSGLQLGFLTLNDAMNLVRNVSGWRVVDRNDVKLGTTYQASVRMRLDTALMPKPFQINAVNNRDWNMSSDWQHFLFTPSALPAPPARASALAIPASTAASAEASAVSGAPSSASDHGQ